uniref:Uncharacterized protein n=1 Tax=Magallana gigas TaxID=29159 RepID=K1QGC7_MAGGI
METRLEGKIDDKFNKILERLDGSSGKTNDEKGMNQEAEVVTKETTEVVDFREETSTITEVTQRTKEMVKVEVNFQGNIKITQTTRGLCYRPTGDQGFKQRPTGKM